MVRFKKGRSYKMSWDVSLEINTGSTYIEIGESRGMTYNVSSMYNKAFELEGGFRGLNEMFADEAVDYLEHAINEMKSNKEEYEKLNPKNGWGNYEGALELLEWLHFQCTEHSLARIRIS